MALRSGAMRRRRTALLALAATAALAACDTDDGRQMQTPDSFTRFQLQSTTPSTTSTVAPPPTELALIPTTSSSTSTTSSTTSTSALSSTANAPTTTSAGVATQAPDNIAQSMQFSGPWDDGAAIPASFTCDGAGDSPLITWTAPPDGTVELALSVTDSDADGFVHWLVVELPAQAGSLGGGEPTAVGAEAVNSFGDPGWGGPCPPPGAAPHTYVFTLHLLDQQLELPADTPTNDLLNAVDAATAQTATFTGTYERA
jgi:Raf kinase inhibitor-like YbhB/YbcL family protein